MKYIGAIICAVAAALLLLYPREISAAVCSAVYDCLDVMIPSLFAFTVLAVYIQGSSVGRLLLKPFALPLAKLLRLDEELCGVILLSNIGGYPVGAKLLTGLVKSGRLSSQDASRLMCCCYGSGPAFVIGIVGARVYGNAAAGGIIFAACMLTSLIIAVSVCRRGERIRLSEGSEVAEKGLVGAVKSGASVMMTVCTMIVAFSVVIELLEITGISALSESLAAALGAKDGAGAVTGALLEISRIRELAASEVWAAPMCGALLSFGGVCVILQVYAITEGAFSLKLFLISRVPAAVLCGALSLPAALLPKAAVECIGGGVAVVEPFSLNIALSACVLIMSGMLLCGDDKSTDV